MSELVIGPSTGWMYAAGINSLAAQEGILDKAGANAVEFCLGTGLAECDERVASVFAGGRCFARVSHWPHKSLHLPDYNQSMGIVFQAEMAERIARIQNMQLMVIHPLKINGEYPVGYFLQLACVLGVGLAIENMDKNKPSGFSPHELVGLSTSCNLLFVLDVQHAYERDPSMSYARELLSALRHKLAYLHVSGESENSNHSLLCRASNTNAVVRFLCELFSVVNVPIVLEGEYQSAEDIAEEIAFLKKELGC